MMYYLRGVMAMFKSGNTVSPPSSTSDKSTQYINYNREDRGKKVRDVLYVVHKRKVNTRGPLIMELVSGM